MSDYAVSIISVTVASSLIVTLASGTRFEKLCTSVSCVLIALCVISPLSGFLRSCSAEDVSETFCEIARESEEKVSSEYERDLENRVADAVERKFPSSRVSSVGIELTDSGGYVYEISRVALTLSGAGEDEVVEYLSELLDCGDVTAVVMEDTGNGY